MTLLRFFIISALVHVSFWGAFLFVQSRHEKILDLTDVVLLEGETTAGGGALGSTPPSTALPKAVPKPTVAALKESVQNPTETTPDPIKTSTGETNSVIAHEGIPSTENYGGSVHGDYGSLSRLPRIKKEVKADYPIQAKEAGISGPVVLEVIVGQDGMVKAAKVLRGPGYGLEDAALKAIAHFEFQPAFKDKEPVAVKIHYTYRFKLDIN